MLSKPSVAPLKTLPVFSDLCRKMLIQFSSYMAMMAAMLATYNWFNSDNSEGKKK
jgi:hypothetical protein